MEFSVILISSNCAPLKYDEICTILFGVLSGPTMIPRPWGITRGMSNPTHFFNPVDLVPGKLCALISTTHAEGVGDRLEVCDTDSLIKESKDSTADWSG